MVDNKVQIGGFLSPPDPNLRKENLTSKGLIKFSCSYVVLRVGFRSRVMISEKIRNSLFGTEFTARPAGA